MSCCWHVGVILIGTLKKLGLASSKRYLPLRAKGIIAIQRIIVNTFSKVRRGLAEDAAERPDGGRCCGVHVLCEGKVKRNWRGQ